MEKEKDKIREERNKGKCCPRLQPPNLSKVQINIYLLYIYICAKQTHTHTLFLLLLLIYSFTNELLQPAATSRRRSSAARLSGGVWKRRVSAAGISAARLPSAGVSGARLSSSAVRSSVRSAAAASTEFNWRWLHGRLFGCSLLLLPLGGVLLR